MSDELAVTLPSAAGHFMVLNLCQGYEVPALFDAIALFLLISPNTFGVVPLPWQIRGVNGAMIWLWGGRRVATATTTLDCCTTRFQYQSVCSRSSSVFPLRMPYAAT